MTKFQTKKMSIIILILFLITFFLPLSTPCIGYGSTCASAPDSNGEYRTSTTIKPLGFRILERVFDVNLPGISKDIFHKL